MTLESKVDPVSEPKAEPKTDSKAEANAKTPMWGVDLNKNPKPAADGKDPAAKNKKPATSGNVSPFMRFSIYFSLFMNLILLIVVIVLVGLIFQIRDLVGPGLIGRLHDSFILMDEATITAKVPVNDTINVKDSIRVNFPLDVATNTTVTLTKPIVIPNTTVYLNGSPVRTDIVLPEGTPLDIALAIVVNVDKMVPIDLIVPVNLMVDVNIPLKDTELHEPFVALAETVAPYDALLDNTPAGWGDIPRWLMQR